MAARRSPQDLIFDPEALARALKAPLPPRLNPTTMRPPGGRYSLEHRLPGVMGSVAPPSEAALRAMTASFPEKKSNHAAIVAAMLFVLAIVTGAVVVRDRHRAPTADAAPAAAPD